MNTCAPCFGPIARTLSLSFSLPNFPFRAAFLRALPPVTVPAAAAPTDVESDAALAVESASRSVLPLSHPWCKNRKNEEISGKGKNVGCQVAKKNKVMCALRCAAYTSMHGSAVTVPL